MSGSDHWTNRLGISSKGRSKHVVAAGYDAMATRFDEWQKQLVGSLRMCYGRSASVAELISAATVGTPDVEEQERVPYCLAVV